MVMTGIVHPLVSPVPALQYRLRLSRSKSNRDEETQHWSERY